MIITWLRADDDQVLHLKLGPGESIWSEVGRIDQDRGSRSEQISSRSLHQCKTYLWTQNPTFQSIRIIRKIFLFLF